MKILVETERLILRKVLPTDVNGFYELDSDPLVHKYLGNRPIDNLNQCKETINFIRKQYKDYGIARWAIINKETNEFMGWTGLKYNVEPINNHTNFYDLGYRLLRKYWGQGYATESALASLNYGFENLELREIYAAAHIDNQASNKILVKLGFEFIQNFEYDGAVHYWYKIRI